MLAKSNLKVIVYMWLNTVTQTSHPEVEMGSATLVEWLSAICSQRHNFLHDPYLFGRLFFLKWCLVYKNRNVSYGSKQEGKATGVALSNGLQPLLIDLCVVLWTSLALVITSGSIIEYVHVYPLQITPNIIWDTRWCNISCSSVGRNSYGLLLRSSIKQ